VNWCRNTWTSGGGAAAPVASGRRATGSRGGRTGAEKPGWLPPSLESRIANILTWVRRMGHGCPVGTLSLELVKFDTAPLADPSLVGAAYQQGIREGMEIREYLLHKWQRRCAYCQ